MINIISTSFHLSIWCSHFIWQRLGCIIFYSCPKPLPAYLRTLQMRWQMLLTTAKCIVLWHEVPLLLYLMSMVSMDRAGLIMFGFPLKNPKPLVGQKLLSCRHTYLSKLLLHSLNFVLYKLPLFFQNYQKHSW